MNVAQRATHDLLAFLQDMALFDGVGADALHELAAGLAHVECRAGERLIRQGEPGDSLYIVRRGRLAVVMREAGGAEVHLSDVSAGQWVGEVALVTGERRTASVYATTDCELLRLSQAQLEWLGRRHPRARERLVAAIVGRLQRVQLSNAIRSSALFEGLEEPALSQLGAELELRVLRGGDVLMRAGEESDALYVVISGLLRVVSEGQAGPGGTLVELRRGQSVGEIGLLTGALRTATVYAVRDSLLARLARPGFERLLAAHPHAILQQFAAPVINRLGAQIQARGHASSHVATIALVPCDPQVPLAELAAQLAHELAAAGTTLVLSSADVDRALGQPGAAQTPADTPASTSVVSWLNEQESAYRHVLYVADPYVSEWTSRCVRQADRIVVVADAGASPAPGPLERVLLAPGDPRIAAERCLVLIHPPDAERPRGTERWLAARQLTHHYHVRRGRPADIARLGRLLTGRGVGVVLSGGGALGFGHIGALRALREAGVPIDMIGGTSQGGLVACQYAMGWDHATIMAKNDAAIRHRFDYTLPITALMEGAEMSDVTREMFGETRLEEMWLPCFCVTVNLTRAALMVHERGPVWKYARATTSLPGVLPPVIDGSDMLVDGGLINNLPTDVMRQRSDCGVVFAIDAGAAAGGAHGHTPPYETSISGWRVLWNRLNPFARKLRVPTMGSIMVRVAIINDAQRSRISRDLADYYMRLSVGSYGLLEFRALKTIAEAGYRSARERIAGWQEDERFRALTGAS